MAILGYCERCGRDVEAAYRSPTRRKWAKAYFMLAIPFVPLLPMMAADFAVCIPGMMVYMLGVGPVVGILKDPPECTRCGAIVRAGVAARTAPPVV